MRYKHLENANIDISALAVGTWAIGGENYGPVNEKDSIAAIQSMFDGGVNLIDTAPAYGAGHSERIVGKALKGYRDKVYVATKFGISNSPEGEMVRNGSYENTIKECDDSLKRLDIDYIDIYIQHWPDFDTPVEETMRALNDLKKAGKIRFIGVSNFDQELIQRAQTAAKVDFLQPPYSMVNRTQEELMKWCAAQGIGSMTYGSLGAGVLTGAIREIPDWDVNDWRFTFYDFYKEPKFSKVMELLNTMDEISKEKGKPLAQIAINWSTQKDYVSTAICGVRNPEEAKENCSAFDWKLTDEEMKLLDQKVEQIGL